MSSGCRESAEGVLVLNECSMESMQRLFALRVDIDARIEPILLEACNDPSGFVSEVKKTGKVIYRSR